jgi:hypothetical protein
LLNFIAWFGYEAIINPLSNLFFLPWFRLLRFLSLILRWLFGAQLLFFRMVLLKVQKRLAAAVLKCGKRKVWIDPNETSEVSTANSRLFFFFTIIF